ncbi:MAG: hypothetical protein AB7U38_00230 [Hyphomicrobiales bacterium]
MKTLAVTLGAAAFAAAGLFAALPAGAADVPAHYPPAGGNWKPAATYECFAVFARKRDGYGEQITRYGPEAVSEIGDLRYPDGRRLNNRVRSVRTGQGAWLELYNGRDFRRVIHRVGPGSVVNLVLPSTDSYRLSCEPPVIQTRAW